MENLPVMIEEPTPAAVLQWLEDNNTLHRTVETLYVVDGYQVEITQDGERVAGPWHGKTLFEALTKAMNAGVPVEDDVAFESLCHEIHDAALAGHAKRIGRHIGDVNTATRGNPTWALVLVRAGYAAGAQAGVDPDVPAAAERTLEGSKADWWFNDPNLPRGTKLYLAPQQSVIDNALRYEHIRAHSYVEVECDSPRVAGWKPEHLDALVDEARGKAGTTVATPSETWIVVKEHAWEHGDGQRPTLAYLLPSEFGRSTHASFEAASAFIEAGDWPLGFVAMQLEAPTSHAKAADHA